MKNIEKVKLCELCGFQENTVLTHRAHKEIPHRNIDIQLLFLCENIEKAKLCELCGFKKTMILI